METQKSTRIQTQNPKEEYYNKSFIMPKTNNTDFDLVDLVDRISDLHDSILSFILSCLPTKDAVATSILSKRWKSVWTTVHNLDFCLWRHDEISMYVYKENVKFVNRVLLLHDCKSLNKFSLIVEPNFIPSHVCSWITIAITKNVHDLFLLANQPGNDLLMELPVSLFSCASLQRLDLSCYISFSDAIVVCFPRLETLKLGSISFKSEEAFENLISGCPMLSTLHLDLGTQRKESYSGDFFMYKISSTSLRRLQLHVEVKFGDKYSPFGLLLEASSLEYLKLYGWIVQVCVRGTLSSLVEAHFIMRIRDIDENSCNKVVKAVRAFDCVKALTLSEDAMLGLSKATIPLSTKFKRLTKLEKIGKYVVYSKWTAPVEVPKCLSNSLKMVEFIGYEGCDVEFIGYMLRHGNVFS